MINEIKLLLGDAASNYTEEQIKQAALYAQYEVMDYCNRDLDPTLEAIANRIAVIKLNCINTEGLASQAYSGVSETFINGYPADILAVLNRKRKIKVVG